MYRVNRIEYCYPNSTEVHVAILDVNEIIEKYDIKIVSVKGPYLSTTLVPIKRPKSTKPKEGVYQLPESFGLLRVALENSNFLHRKEAILLLERQSAIIYAKKADDELPDVNNTEFKRQLTILVSKHKRFRHRSNIVKLLGNLPVYC